MFSPLINVQSTPRFITEFDFANFGKFTGTSTSAQIRIAFAIAERQVEEEIGTYLFNTVVTDEVTNFNLGERFYLPVGKVHSISNVIFYERTRENEVIMLSGFGIVDNTFYGAARIYISPHDTSSSTAKHSCNGCFVGANNSLGIYKADITYLAGYETGTAHIPMMKMALCEAADLVLKTIRDEGELADEAHQFIKNYSIGRYQQSVEHRWAKETRFGWSGKAQFISNLIDPFKIKRAKAIGVR